MNLQNRESSIVKREFTIDDSGRLMPLAGFIL